MAIVVKHLAVLTDPTNDALTATFEVEYDNVTNLLTLLRCINNMTVETWASAVRQSDGQVYSRIFPPQQTTTIAIPTNQAGKIQITVDGGRLLGASFNCGLPA